MDSNMARPEYYVTKARVLEGYRLRLAFADETQGTVDLSDVVARGGVFRALKDPNYFKLARADADAGTVVWPDDVDLAPEELYARAHAGGRRSARSATAGSNGGARRPVTSKTRRKPHVPSTSRAVAG